MSLKINELQDNFIQKRKEVAKQKIELHLGNDERCVNMYFSDFFSSHFYDAYLEIISNKNEEIIPKLNFLKDKIEIEISNNFFIKKFEQSTTIETQNIEDKKFVEFTVGEDDYEDFYKKYPFFQKVSKSDFPNFYSSLVQESVKKVVFENHHKLREERSYFLLKIKQLIEKQIISLKGNKKTKPKPAPLRSTIWKAPHFAILFDLLQKNKIIVADKIRVVELFADFAGVGVQGLKEATTKTYLKKHNEKTINNNLLIVREDLQKMIDEIDTYLIRE